MKVSHDAFLKLCGNPLGSFQSILFYGNSEFYVQTKINYLLKQNPTLHCWHVKTISQDVLFENKDFFLTLLKTKDLFSGPELLILTQATDKMSPIIEDILGSPTVSFFIIKAQEYLKPASKLRKLYEQHANAASVPCYELSVSDLQQEIISFFSSHRKQINKELAYQLAELFHLTPDIMKNELNKILIYSGNTTIIDTNAIKSVLALTPQTDTNDFINALLEKNKKKALVCIENIDDSTSYISILRPLVSILMRLHQLKCDLRSGVSFENSIKTLLPPTLFTEHALLKKRLSLWTETELETAIKKASHTETLIKLNSHSAKEIFKYYSLSLLA